MGAPVVRKLIDAGFLVGAYDPIEGRSAESGAAVAASAAELALGSDILISVLPGAPEAAEVLLGAGSVIQSLPTESLWLDFTSNDPRAARRVADLAAARRIDAVGAPMAGGVAAAERGELRFFVGGSDGAVARARPVLEALGSFERVGDTVDAGYTAKLLANLLWFGQVVAVTEALLLGASLGLEPARLRGILARGAGGSVFIDEYLDRLLDGDYLETFGIARCVEELEILVSLAGGADVPFELSDTVARIHREALARFGAVDGELLAAKLLEERAGRTLRR
jgi:3-hydroxyisobutyrate dehydrogenase-like beta-hydroxyacid dehydrogenase